jgi:hypothetical protein
MKNSSFIKSRIKRLEEKLMPGKKTIVIIQYGSADSVSTVTINDKNYTIPKNVDPDQFIEENTKHLSGVIMCILYLTHEKNFSIVKSL